MKKLEKNLITAMQQINLHIKSKKDIANQLEEIADELMDVMPADPQDYEVSRLRRAHRALVTLKKAFRA